MVGWQEVAECYLSVTAKENGRDDRDDISVWTKVMDTVEDTAVPPAIPWVGLRLKMQKCTRSG